MAQVLLAYTQTPGGAEYHVLKRIRPDQARDERFVRMFVDEARIAALLKHPNIVQVFEIAEHGEYFFSMEYVHGEDLRRVLMEVNRARDKVPIALITGVVAAAAAGLHYAHQLVGHDRQPLNIVHRDVSPANILVGYDGSVKLADFGIAKAALRTLETRPGTLKGKVSYMSPEQVTGKAIDRRSDVFALGIVLYEIATARRLFKGENDFLTMSAIVQGDIPPPSHHRPDLPRALEDIIMTALSAEPGDRFQSADELRGELEHFMQTLGMRMSPSSIADYMKKLFGSRAQPWLIADEPTDTTTSDFDGSSLGLATIQTAAMPTVQASPGSPLVHARTGVTGRPATVPADGWLEATPMAWSGEAPRSTTRRRVGIALGIAVAATIAGIVILARSDRGSVDQTAGTPSPLPLALPPVPPAVVAPSEPPQAVAAPTAPDPAPAPAPTVAAPEAAPEPAPAEPAPPAASAKANAPTAAAAQRGGQPAKPAEPKPRPVKRITKKRPPPKAWDPDTLFPK